ncbi:hypothetical protein KCA24_32545, partial [Escherichia coli]|nr:hypothetical protein [Escherichia coli]
PLFPPLFFFKNNTLVVKKRVILVYSIAVFIRYTAVWNHRDAGEENEHKESFPLAKPTTVSGFSF